MIPIQYLVHTCPWPSCQHWPDLRTFLPLRSWSSPQTWHPAWKDDVQHMPLAILSKHLEWPVLSRPSLTKDKTEHFLIFKLSSSVKTSFLWLAMLFYTDDRPCCLILLFATADCCCWWTMLHETTILCYCLTLQIDTAVCFNCCWTLLLDIIAY